jgi:hypothetical protein
MTKGMLAAVVAGMLVAATEGQAQETGRPITIEGTVGWSAFADDDSIEHTVFGGGARIPLTPRLSVGPEVTYMIGPGSDRDLFVLGTLWFDFFRPRPGLRVVPFLVASGGFMHHRNEFVGEAFSGNEGATYGGGGVRVRFNDRLYAGVDARIGWEPHLRLAGHVGINLR